MGLMDVIGKIFGGGGGGGGGGIPVSSGSFPGLGSGGTGGGPGPGGGGGGVDANAMGKMLAPLAGMAGGGGIPRLDRLHAGRTAPMANATACGGATRCGGH